MTAIDFPPLFIELFTRKMGMDKQEFEFFFSHFREMTIRKKDYYLKEGSISNAKAYIKKGCSRTFVIDDDGKEHIISLLSKIGGWLILKVIIPEIPGNKISRH